MTDRDDEADPLLVRPYLLDEPGGTAPPAAGHTWPGAAAAPVPEPADPTVVLPVTAPPPRGPRRRHLVLGLAAVLVLVLGGVALLVSSLLPGSGTTSALPDDVPLPAPVVSEPAPATTAPSAAGATTAPATARTRTTGGPAATPSSPSPAAKVSSTAVPARTTTSPPAPMLIAPPVDRVGRIHGPGGLCLDLRGAIPADDTPIQVFTCNDSPAQMWNLAADGTLWVVGRCAVAAGDGTVRILGCDGRRSAQWRAGQDRALVNLAAGDCLTDPSTGTRSGTGVRIEDCSGAERQRWELP